MRRLAHTTHIDGVLSAHLVPQAAERKSAARQTASEREASDSPGDASHVDRLELERQLLREDGIFTGISEQDRLVRPWGKHPQIEVLPERGPRIQEPSRLFGLSA